MFQIRVFPKEIPIGKEAVKVITYNVNNFNTDGKKQLPNIADWLRKEDPDIVCLQECPVESALRMDSVAKTLSFLPYYCSTRSATKAAGNAIFSKYPILRFESILYPESSNKSLFAVMDIQGDSVRVFNNHFQTTSVNAVKPRLYQAHAEGKQLEETEAAFHMAFQMKKNFVKRATQADYIRQMLCPADYADFSKMCAYVLSWQMKVFFFLQVTDAVRSLKCLLRLHCILVCPFL